MIGVAGIVHLKQHFLVLQGGGIGAQKELFERNLALAVRPAHKGHRPERQRGKWHFTRRVGLNQAAPDRAPVADLSVTHIADHMGQQRQTPRDQRVSMV